ncbi:putative porin [Flavimarina sp. Hel_I_48]|uniref:putative porin n=1 Tax=Flavimarina sp. Hel_I_48 TaxID=1392488 RepID=UPI0009DCB361|nr:putative porin [Flavimarina sp. Hel_I_48]
MKNTLTLLGFLLISFIQAYAQVRTVDSTSTQNESSQRSSLRKDPNEKDKRPRPPVDLYKIISIENDTTVVDTSLTIEKFYKYNYLRRDNFELLPFANTGQTYNTLVYTFDEQSSMPLFGARAKHFNYMEVEDIHYYEVPTPLTELYFKSVFEQGQTLDAFYTMNTSKQFNFSIGYKGSRSLGKYQNILTSTGNFRFAFSYHTKDKRYNLKAHFAAQDLLNNENGGITEQALLNFQSNDGQFDDRSTLAVNFEDAENIMIGKRFFIDHSYELLLQRDSVPGNSFKVSHRLNFTDKFYRYDQTSPSALFGDSFQASNLRDRVDLEDFNNQLSVVFSNPILGKLGASLSHSHYDYGYNSVLILETGDRIPNRLTGDIIAAGANYDKKIGTFDFRTDAQINVSGPFDGYNLHAQTSYNWKNKAKFEAELIANSRAANFNHLLYQSSYSNYNWFNEPQYSNVKTNTLKVGIKSEKWMDLEASFSSIDNYAYFAIDPSDTLVNSFQAGESVSYWKVKAHKQFNYGKLSLDNTVAYQNVSSGADYMNVPELTIRNTLYYTDEWFDKALFIQTGVNFKYFSAYSINAYDPVLAEFYVQNDTNIGAFPLIDIFFNMKIQQTRVFFIAEHVNSSFTGNDYFSAPGYPYRDFIVRFGLVWNFFL